jgi:hypothetical protein
MIVYTEAQFVAHYTTVLHDIGAVAYINSASSLSVLDTKALSIA